MGSGNSWRAQLEGLGLTGAAGGIIPDETLRKTPREGFAPAFPILWEITGKRLCRFVFTRNTCYFRSRTSETAGSNLLLHPSVLLIFKLTFSQKFLCVIYWVLLYLSVYCIILMQNHNICVLRYLFIFTFCFFFFIAILRPEKAKPITTIC